jgi:hypothetical protein
MDMPGKKPTAQTCSRISYSCKRSCKLIIRTDLEDYKIHTTEALIVDTYLELVCMHKAIQWQSNKHKLHCVDGLAALLHTTAYYIPGLQWHFTLMGADASSLASAMSSPNDFSQLLGSDSEMPPRCHGLYHCTCPSCSQRGLAAFLELQRALSLDPGLLQFLSFATSKLDHVLALIHQETPEKSYHAKHPPPPSLRRTPRSAEVVVVRSICKAKRVMQNQR